jgi:hypothetical protein
MVQDLFKKVKRFILIRFGLAAALGILTVILLFTPIGYFAFLLLIPAAFPFMLGVRGCIAQVRNGKVMEAYGIGPEQEKQFEKEGKKWCMGASPQPRDGDRQMQAYLSPHFLLICQPLCAILLPLSEVISVDQFEVGRVKGLHVNFSNEESYQVLCSDPPDGSRASDIDTWIRNLQRLCPQAFPELSKSKKKHAKKH